MDHPTHGVKTTIIDLGLARMDADGSAERIVRWTPFEDEIFEGEGSYLSPFVFSEHSLHRPGDYQFDVYRMMKTCNGNEWDSYNPLTNVLVCTTFRTQNRFTQSYTVVALHRPETPACQTPPCPYGVPQSGAHGNIQRSRMSSMPY